MALVWRFGAGRVFSRIMSPMPNEAKNKHGRTLLEQIKAAADATAQEQDAKKRAKEGKHTAKHEAKQDESASKHGKTTKRRASKEQLKQEKDAHKKARRQEREAAAKARKEGKPLRTALESVLAVPFPLKVVGGIVIFVLLSFALLYPMGCTYYQAMREQQRYQAELDAVNARNDIIQQENSALGTDEGVESQARKELGWVKDGEQAVIISNSDSDISSGMPDQVDEDSIEAPHTWYYDILDVVFQAKTRS